MSNEWTPHVVQQGDHARKLAFRAGATPDEVWDHDKNKELAARRKSMDQLCPGDVLHLPGEPKPGLDVEMGTANRFKAVVPTVGVHLKLSDAGEPWANEPYEVHGLGGAEPLRGTTGASGEITIEAPVFAREITISLRDGFCIVPIRVGDLDPVDAGDGARQRLRALGYLPDEGDVDDDMERSAVRRFREKEGLDPDGGLDAEALDALAAAHRS